jgi:hypothetical protein
MKRSEERDVALAELEQTLLRASAHVLRSERAALACRPIAGVLGDDVQMLRPEHLLECSERELRRDLLRVVRPGLHVDESLDLPRALGHDAGALGHDAGSSALS